VFKPTDTRRDEIIYEFMTMSFAEHLRHNPSSYYSSAEKRMQELIQQYHDDVLDPQRQEAEDEPV
jgi:hypothetical protein